MSRNDPTIDFTTEELLVIAEITGGPLPAGLEIESLDELPAAYRDYARQTAERTLRARRVVQDGIDGRPVVVDAVRAMLEVVGSPGLLGVCALEEDGVVETRFFCASPELGVEHAAIATSVHRFTPFLTRDFLARLLRFADLRPARVPDVDPFEVPLSVLERVGESVSRGEVDAGRVLLMDAGVPEAAAAVFAAAFANKKSTVTVTVLTRPDPEKVVGGMLVWLDAGLDGNWVTEGVDDAGTVVGAGAGAGGGQSDIGSPDPVVLLRPESAEQMAAELLSFLPDAFGDDPTRTPATPDADHEGPAAF